MLHDDRKKKVLYWSIFSGLIITIVLFALLYTPYLADLFHPGNPIATKQIQIGKRTLIIAPHPDDETLGAAGMIQQALAAGNQVKVLMMTTGDGYKTAVEVNYHKLSPKSADYRKMGEERHLETLEAMKHLGVKKEDVIFLGYPDGGINSLWQNNWDYNHLLHAINGADHSPYAFSYEKEAPYCGENVVKNLTEVIQEFQPTDIVYSDPNDQHPDHWATNAFVKYVLVKQHYQAKEWTFLVHRGDFPVPWLYRPNDELSPPHALIGLDTHWISFPINEHEEQKKAEAISKHVTQMKVMDPFLDAFVRKNELFGTYNPTVLPFVKGHPDFDRLDQIAATFSKDAVEDTVRKELHKEADITTIGGALSDEGLSVRLDTRATISARVTYNIRIRFFQPDHVNRIDMTFHDSKLASTSYASNNINLPHDSTFRVTGNHLWITLPARIAMGLTDFLISADTYVGNELIDKTAWQLVRVKQGDRFR